MTRMEKWAAYFSPATSDEELEEIAADEEAIREAMEVEDVFTKDAAIQEIMESYSLPDKEAAALVNSNW